MNRTTPLKIYIDGSCRANKLSGIGVYAVLQDSVMFTLSRTVPVKTNNQAEYMALLIALDEADRLNFDYVEVYCDSKLVVEQVKGNWRINDEVLKDLHYQAIDSSKDFVSFNIKWIPRHKNNEANDLAQASTLDLDKTL